MVRHGDGFSPWFQRMDPHRTGEDGKIPWILAQLFLEFMKHTNIYQYSLHETHQKAFCSVNKQLCSSYLPLLRLSDSACWFLMGYRFISVWNACVLYPSESSVENNSYMICAHFLQLNLAEKGGRCGSASAPVPPIVCLSAGSHCCGTERGCQRLSEARIINRWQSWSSSTCSLSLSTSETNVPVRQTVLDWFTLSFLQEKPWFLPWKTGVLPSKTMVFTI